MDTHYIAIVRCRHYYASKSLKVGLPVHVMPLGKYCTA